MAKLVIDDLDDEVMKRLEGQAALREETVSIVVKDMIKRGLSPSRAEAAAAFRHARSLTPPGPQTDSTLIIREMRDE